MQRPRTTLSGIIVDNRTGDPVSGASVIVASDGTTVQDRTGPKGGYRLSVPPGEHEIHVCAPGYLPDETRRTVDGEYEREDRSLHPLVNRTVDLAGVVRDVQVHVPLENGSVRLQAEQFASPNGSVHVTEGQKVDVDFRETLTKERHRTGACADQAGTYQSLADGETVTRFPGPDGNFAFRNLPAGRYSLTASAPNHVNESITLPQTTVDTKPTESLRHSRSVRFYLEGPTVNTTGVVEGWKPTDDGRKRVPLGKFDVNASLRQDTRIVYGPFHDGYAAETDGDGVVETGRETRAVGPHPDGSWPGYYNFTAFPTGQDIENSKYHVSAWSAGYQRTAQSRPRPPGEPVDFVLDYVNSSVSVEVVSPVYSNDAGESLPVTGATVRLAGKPGDTAGDNVPATEGVDLTQTVDGTGEANFENIPPGRYTVAIESRTLEDGNVSATFPARERTLYVSPGEDVRQRFELSPERGRINGRLLTFDDLTQTRATGTDRSGVSWDWFTYRPLPEAAVEFTSGSFRGYEVVEAVEVQQSGDNGVYGRVVSPANYETEVRKDNFLARQDLVAVSSGDESNPLTKLAPARDYFSGVVSMGTEGMATDEIHNRRGPESVTTPGVHLEDQLALPRGGGYGLLRNATVTFESDEETFTVETDDSGRFVILEVPEGEYEVTVDHPHLGGTVTLPETLKSDGTGRFKRLFLTAEPLDTVAVSVEYMLSAEGRDTEIAVRDYTLAGQDHLGKLRAQTVDETGKPVQNVPAKRPFSVIVPDRRADGLGFCPIGTTRGGGEFTFVDRLETVDCPTATISEPRTVAGHIYGLQDWQPVEGAKVTLEKRTQDGGFSTVGTDTAETDGWYNITSPITGDSPVASHRMTIDHPTIHERSSLVAAEVPGTSLFDLYPRQKVQNVTLTVEDSAGNPIDGATVTVTGDGLQTAQQARVRTDRAGNAHISVHTPYEGQMQLSIRRDGYFPVEATTEAFEFTRPGAETVDLSVQTEKLPAPDVTLTDMQWVSDGSSVGAETHVLSGIEDPDTPNRTTVRLDVETDRLANLDGGPDYAGSAEIETVVAPYASETAEYQGQTVGPLGRVVAPSVQGMTHEEWLLERDPVGSVRLRVTQDANGIENVSTGGFERRNGGHPGEWEMTLDLEDLPPTHYVDSESRNTERQVSEPLSLVVNATTVKGGTGAYASTFEEERIFVNRPPSLYNWIYQLTGGETTEPGYDSISTRNLKIPSQQRGGIGFETTQRIRRTNSNRLRYAIEQDAMVEFAWFESPDNLKKVTTASKKWGVKATGSVESVVNDTGVVDTAEGDVAMRFAVPDEGPLSGDLVGATTAGNLDIEIENQYPLPPKAPRSTPIAGGDMIVNGTLDGTVTIDAGQAMATLLGGVATQQIAKAASESDTAPATTVIDGGPRAGVALGIDHRLFPYDLQVREVDEIALGAETGIQVESSLGMGAGKSQANARIVANLTFDTEGDLDPETGTVSGAAESSVTLLGYTLWQTAPAGVVLRQEFGTGGQVSVIERHRGTRIDRADADRGRYATFRGERGILVADTYRFANPSVTSRNGTARFLFAQDGGDAPLPDAFELRTSTWDPGEDGGPTAPGTVVDGRVVDSDVGTVDGRTAVAVSVVAHDPRSSYPPTYLDDTEIHVYLRTGDGWERQFLTDSEFMQVRPQIDDGLVAWTVDRDGLPWTVDDRLVQSVQYAGDGFGTPRQIGGVPVIGKAVSSGEGNRDTAVVLVETDTNVWTETDREVRKFTSEDQESGWTEQSAADAIGSPAAASGVTAWIGSNNGNETIRVTIDDGPVTTLATAAEIQSVTAATFSGDPLVTWAEERGNETLVRGRRYTGESWLDPGTAERVGANLSDLEVSVDQQSERLVGTYTIPGSARQSRTVRYFSVQFATEVDDERATTEVPVDVMPGEENVIDPDDETVEVVVFGGEVFDAKTVVDRVESVRFGSSDELDSGGGVGPRDDATDAGRVEDINGDGTPDLVIEFAAPDNRTISLEQVVIDTPAVRYVGTADVRFEPRETDESPPASEKTDSSERSDDDDFPWVWVLGAGGLLALFLYYARGRVDGRTDQPESG